MVGTPTPQTQTRTAPPDTTRVITPPAAQQTRRPSIADKFRKASEIPDTQGLNMILYGVPGVGKALPLTAKVLTPTGWKLMGMIEVGDEVISTQGTTSHVTGVYPQGEREMYTVEFSDGVSVDCDRDHLWSVHSTRDPRDVPTPTWKIAADITSMTDSLRRVRRRFIPIARAAELGNGQELLLDPYLLGALLGDGGLKRVAAFSTADEEMLAAVGSLVPTPSRVVFRGPTGNGGDYHIVTDRGVPNPVLMALEALGLRGLGSHEKFVPHSYLFTSAANRLALLQGLMDTDGWVQKTRRTDNDHEGRLACFGSSSEQLAKDVRTLAQSLGGVAHLHHRPDAVYTYKGESLIGRETWRVGVVLPPEVPVFRLTRKARDYAAARKSRVTRSIRSIAPTIPQLAQCISVDAPDHCYITDHFVVTHNTVLSATAQDSEYGADVLFIDIEGGTRSISDRTDITVIRPEKFDEVRDVFEWIIRSEHTFKTFVIDTISEGQSLGMRDIMLTAKDPEWPGMQDWGKSTEQMLRLVRAFRDLALTRSWNVIMTAHAREQKDEVEGRIYVRPNLTPKVTERIGGIVDVLGYMSKEDDGTRILTLEPTRRVMAKYRQPLKGNVPPLPGVIRNPSLVTILNHLRGGVPITN
jgi:hypothetical protein